MPDPILESLFVTRNFPPLVGGMERVAEKIYSGLAEMGNATLVAPKGSGAFALPGADVRECNLRPLWRFLAEACWETWRAIWRKRPSVIVGGSGLVAPLVVVAARLIGSRSVVYVHGLDLVVRSAAYQWLWLPWIRRADTVVCNSANTRRLAIERGVPAHAVHVINPGVEMPEPPALPDDGFRLRHRLGEGPLLLSVGRFTRRKGLAEFVATVLPQVVSRFPDVTLLIIGDEASDALSGGGGSEWGRIEACATRAGVAGNLRRLGRCSDLELAAAYAAASCHVFPVLDLPGDVEGFGMVALESSAHGLPTVAYRSGGIPDAVEEGVSGDLVDPGDFAGFAAAVVRRVSAPPSLEQRAAMRAFAAARDWNSFKARFRAIVAGDA